VDLIKEARRLRKRLGAEGLDVSRADIDEALSASAASWRADIRARPSAERLHGAGRAARPRVPMDCSAARPARRVPGNPPGRSR
jgi:hypothetical protein